jgi:hypothetical protein
MLVSTSLIPVPTTATPAFLLCRSRDAGSTSRRTLLPALASTHRWAGWAGDDIATAAESLLPFSGCRGGVLSRLRGVRPEVLSPVDQGVFILCREAGDDVLEVQSCLRQ